MDLPLDKIGKALIALQFIQGIKIETGKLSTPDGTGYVGFKVTIGKITDPSEIVRTYQDVEKILRNNRLPYKTSETKTALGTFKSYTVTT